MSGPLYFCAIILQKIINIMKIMSSTKSNQKENDQTSQSVYSLYTSCNIGGRQQQASTAPQDLYDE